MAITDKDVEKFKKVFVTKEDLKEELKRFATKEELFKTEGRLNSKIEDLRSEMHQKFDQVLTGQDKIIKELQTAREEKIVTGGQIRDHERRITVLEAKVV